MANLPNEIIVSILSNLPVKSLLRFKCVSKSWCSWISCPKFKLSNQGRQGAIVEVYKGSTRKSFFQSINQQLTLEELNDPFMIGDDETPLERCMFLGSCDGLILINLNQHIYLWNPATRFSTKVLELNRLTDDGYYIRGGLCFDSSKNVYKAVLIMQHQTPSYGGEFVIVASLEDKKWRFLEFPYDIPSVSSGITLHGRLHYKARVEKSYKNNGNNMWERVSSSNQIIYFDPISEEFNMFSVPEPKSNQEENDIVGLGVLNECLCMTRLEDDKGGVEILVMKEYGVKESWTSLFFIRNLEISPSYGFAVPLYMTETGGLALITDDRGNKVVVHNPKNDNMKNIFVEGKTGFRIGPIITYVESLIKPEEYYWSKKRHKQFGKL
ncbi:F-box protein CPR1-like [Lycium barbarum]|uniref:F-box protein CPR1-like n=1 Tax=Lycium barbarum TaxID=112863 RepID=UPI00293E3206|nr:F-box protein CPR1-like [Lycium barbarum]